LRAESAIFGQNLTISAPVRKNCLLFSLVAGKINAQFSFWLSTAKILRPASDPEKVYARITFNLNGRAWQLCLFFSATLLSSAQFDVGFG
jgi:hypothetical protein